MGLLSQIQADVKQITTDAGAFGTAVVFETPDGNTTVTVNALTNKIGLAFNANSGAPVNSKAASVVVSEAALVAAGYTVRNASNEVYLRKHKVTWTDSSGTEWTYSIAENIPDETLGLITCILKDYGG